MNETKINTIVTIISIVITVIFGVFGIWGGLSGVSWYWIPLVIVFLTIVGLIFYRRRNFKPKPRLTISVRDINCYIERRNVRRHNQASGIKFEGMVSIFHIEMIVEVKNRSLVSANYVAGDFKLELKHNGHLLTFETNPGQISRLNIRKKKSALIRVVFPEVDLTKDHYLFYPESIYDLNYIYRSNELTQPRRTKFRGKLKKVDWTGLTGQMARDLIAEINSTSRVNVL